MCLDKNEKIKARIYQEIKEYIFKNKSTEIEYDKVHSSLLYLECALLETLRLHPAVPFLMRYAMEDVLLPNGNVIKKGDEVVVPTFAFGRNPKIFTNPLVFDPNRFFDKDKDPINVFDVYQYPFFNTNPRLCLGRKLAMLSTVCIHFVKFISSNMHRMEAKVFVFYFFQRYEFEMSDPTQEIKIKTGIVLNMKQGLRLKLAKKK